MQPKDHITIGVLGIGFPNKGAELMLEAIREWAEALPVRVRIALPLNAPFAHRVRFSAWAIASHPWRFGNLAPAKVCDKLGLVRDCDVDVLIDASGYAYGDPWGAAKAANRLGNSIEKLKRKGKRVILLPQAFGPFLDRRLKRVMYKIIQHADLIYARDPISLDALFALDSSNRSIRRGYDFTCLVSGKPFNGMESNVGAIGLIPNHKMYSMGTTVKESGYLDYLVNVSKGLLAREKKVVLILHEGEKDRQICEIINERLGGRLTIVARENPKEIKMAIGCCSAVLTSRFHGFASALFQSVPALATTWSHKYEMLATDFGVEEYILKLLDADATIEHLMKISEECDVVKLRLSQSAEDLKIKVKSMWREIETLIQI